MAPSLMRGNSLCPLNDKCVDSLHPKISFRCVIRSVIVSSCLLSGPYWRWWFGLLHMSLYFSFFLSLLENYSLTLLVVSTSTSIQIYLIFNFYSWLFYRSFIYFQFHHFILICYILCFSIWSSLFWFLIFFS
jgi:hypothetical protein